MKCCTKCKETFELSYFGKSKHNTDGLYHWCKGCVKADNKKRRNVADKGLIWKQSLYDNNEKYCSVCSSIKKFSEFHKHKHSVSGFSSMCKICKRKSDANYRQKLKDDGVYKERRRKQYLDNIDQYREYGLKYNKNGRDYKREYQRVLKLRDKNPLAKLKNALRNRILIAIKYHGYRKNLRTEEILGAKWGIVKSHIETQFTDGMSWGNHGEWHIDHIISLKTATTKSEMIELNHYTNLQPLWATTREINGTLYEGNLNKG